MEPFIQIDESYFLIENWRKRSPQLVAGFTTKKGGVSNKAFANLNMGLHVKDEHDKVIRNREILAKKIQFPLDHWVVGEQVHGINVKHVTDIDKGKGAKSLNSSIKNVDGLITKTKGILCAAFFADCVPLYFFAPKHQYIGIAHAGWRGTVHGMARQMVKEFNDVGVPSKELLVAIGPCIAQESYEVDQKIIDSIAPEYHENTVIQSNDEKYLLDLKQLNIEILLQSGVLRHNIEVTEFCTFQQKNWFYSHRRDGGITGRMLGFIGFVPS